MPAGYVWLCFCERERERESGNAGWTQHAARISLSSYEASAVKRFPLSQVLSAKSISALEGAAAAAVSARVFFERSGEGGALFEGERTNEKLSGNSRACPAL